MARISLQELTEKYRLLEKTLDTPFSNENLKKVSRIIEDHKVLARELLTPAEIEDIKQEPSQQLQRLAMLEKWKQISGFKATIRELIEALLRCSRADLAQKVCELLTQSEYKHRAINVDM